MTAIPALLLIRTTLRGSGRRSRVSGELIPRTSLSVVFSSVLLSLWFATADLHLLSFLARRQYEICAVKEPINDVGLLAHAVIRHLSLAINAEHDEKRSLAVPHLGWHLDVGLRTVVEHSDRPDVLVAALHGIGEVDFFHGEDCRCGLKLP